MHEKIRVKKKIPIDRQKENTHSSMRKMQRENVNLRHKLDDIALGCVASTVPECRSVRI
jgi:hypothetical protein